MKRIIVYVLLLPLLLEMGCSPSFQAYNFEEEYATTIHYLGMDGDSKVDEVDEKSQLVGVPAKNFYGGDLKRGAIWWTGAGIFLEKGDEFIIDADSIGPNKIPFGATFPPLDLVSEKVRVKIVARAESKSGDAPTLFLQFDDASGYMANANRPSNKIEVSDEFKEYYFELNDFFLQVEPNKHKVNGAMISSIKWFINPGMSSFTGLIYLKEIRIVPAIVE